MVSFVNSDDVMFSTIISYKIIWFYVNRKGNTANIGSLHLKLILQYLHMTMHICVLSRSVMSDSLGPMDYSPLGYPVHRILQARILVWVAIPFSKQSSQLRDQTQVSCIVGGFFTVWVTREALVTMCTPTCQAFKSDFYSLHKPGKIATLKNFHSLIYES